MISNSYEIVLSDKAPYLNVYASDCKSYMMFPFVMFPPPIIWGSILRHLRLPKDGCYSTSDDLCCSFTSWVIRFPFLFADTVQYCVDDGLTARTEEYCKEEWGLFTLFQSNIWMTLFAQ